MWSHRHPLVHSFIKSLWPSIAKRSQLSASLHLTFLFLPKHWFPLHCISEVSSSLPWKAILAFFNDFYFSSWPPNARGLPGSVLVPHLCSTNTPGRSHPISDLKKKKTQSNAGQPQCISTQTSWNSELTHLSSISWIPETLFITMLSTSLLMTVQS